MAEAYSGTGEKGKSEGMACSICGRVTDIPLIASRLPMEMTIKRKGMNNGKINAAAKAVK